MQHVADGTVLGMFATICVAFQRVGLGATVGALAIWLLLH